MLLPKSKILSVLSVCGFHLGIGQDINDTYIKRHQWYLYKNDHKNK